MTNTLPQLSPRYEEALLLASELVNAIRDLSKTFPETEDMALVIDIRQAVMDLHSAVMMTGHVDHREDFLAYTDDTRGKNARLTTYLQMARDLGYCDQATFDALDAKLEALAKLAEPPKKPDLKIV